MAIIRVPVNIVFPGAGSPGANIWHVRTLDNAGSGAALTQLNVLVGYIRTFYDAVKAYIPATTTFTLGTVAEEGSQLEMIPTMAVVTGTGSGSAPQALALVCTWKTSVAARRGRGRTFLGPLASGAIQGDGTPVDLFRSTVLTAAQALVTSSMSYGSGAVAIMGYQNAKLAGVNNPRNPDDPKITRDITGVAIRDLFGILRSRRD